MERQKDRDVYETTQAGLEKELSEIKEKTLREFADREKYLADQEKELSSLREQVANFPEKLELEVATAHEQGEKKVHDELQFKMRLTDNEMNGERKLFDQKVLSFESKIEELETQILTLNKKSDEASKQAQGIALKAIEGASQRHFYPFDASPTKSKSSE